MPRQLFYPTVPLLHLLYLSGWKVMVKSLKMMLCSVKFLQQHWAVPCSVFRNWKCVTN